MYGDNSLQLPATAYLIQQQQQNGGGLQEEAALRKKLSLDSTNNNVIHSSSSSNNILSSKLISVNGIGEAAAAPAPSVSKPSHWFLLKRIPTYFLRQ